MITAVCERAADGHVVAFEAVSHAATEVCAAVSLTVINTANSIEALTQARFTVDYKPDGGFLSFRLADEQPPGARRDACLLTDALALALRALRDRYPAEIEYTEKPSGTRTA